jgi:hypothetical protein
MLDFVTFVALVVVQNEVASVGRKLAGTPQALHAPFRILRVLPAPCEAPALRPGTHLPGRSRLISRRTMRAIPMR